MEQQLAVAKRRRADPRLAATWVGAAIVLACGFWLQSRGGTGASLRHGPRAAVSAELKQELGWIDQRLEQLEAEAGVDDPRQACRIASLHWDRAARLAQHEYYRQYGTSWADDREQEYTTFRLACLRRDRSGDVGAVRRAARRALVLQPPGAERCRALWFLSLTGSVDGRGEEEIGALVELTRYIEKQPWVWRRLSRAFQLRGDLARQELADEQVWRVTSGHAPSAYITRVMQSTPYARPAPVPTEKT